MKDVEVTIALLEQMERMGLAISVDDFGTGYSSLSYLERFPVDQSFIDNVFSKPLPADEFEAFVRERNVMS